MRGTRSAEARAAATPAPEQPSRSESRFSLGRIPGTWRRLAGQVFTAFIRGLEKQGRISSGDWYYPQAADDLFRPDSQ